MNNTTTDNGITYYNEPLLTNCFDFLFKHLDCDSIAKKSSEEPDKVYILAFTTDKKYNHKLNDIFYSDEYNKKGCIILQGIDSQEVDSID
jgi:hypothetical protein